MIYLDNNATTAIDPEVADAIREIWALGPQNPSSQHAAGRRARSWLDEATAAIARRLGADIVRTGGARLLVTSGGTEANHWALSSLAPPDAPLWVSSIEHPSVLATAEAARQGSPYQASRPVRIIPVDSSGRVRLDALADSLRQTLGPPSSTSTATATAVRGAAAVRGLVSVMLANNETGVLQPLAEIAELCREFQVRLHSDATQAVGRIPVDFTALGLDAATFAAHKFHGPVGVGGLLLAPGIELAPLMHGGEQQLGARPGTEPVALVVGMERALRLALESLTATATRIASLRDLLESRLFEAIPECVVHGADAPRLPGTTCISFPGVDRQTLLMRLDMAGVACSTGSACSSGSSEPSHVLRAMGVDAERIESALRFGLSRLSTTEEVISASERIISCYTKLRYR